jgi:L-ascorbate metabolism protein UlaG (beta-lactamase superfamily)
MIERIEWLGHGSFRINGTPLIYIDPWRVARNGSPADIILITHDHYDHCSPADIEKLRGPSTTIITNRMAEVVLTHGQLTVLRPWQVINIGKASIRAVPAYNSHHPKEFEGLGFVISLDHYDIYYAGDTDLIPEMDMLHPDIAILPIGGRQTMNVETAVEAVRKLKPRWVFPSHWGTTLEGGTVFEARMFADQVAGLAEVLLPERVW